MKKVIIFLLIVIVGATAVYFSLDKLNKKSGSNPSAPVEKNASSDKNEEAPTKDAFVKEAERLQSIAENREENVTCKCYSVKDLDPSSKLVGSILVHTTDDLFVSTMWLSNGYYLLDGVESAAVGTVEDSADTASLYCGEESANSVSSLCF